MVINIEKLINEFGTFNYSFTITDSSLFRVYKKDNVEDYYESHDILKIISFLFRLKDPKSNDKYKRMITSYCTALESFTGGFFNENSTGT